jgi:ABC-2 type transport system permease protein
VAAGGIAFGYGPFPTLSGPTIGAVQATLRIGLSAGYVLAGIAGLTAIGVFISSLTDSAPGAAIATVGLAVVSQILDGLSSLRAIHPYLPSHDWLAFADLFRAPIAWDAMRHGIVVFAAYTVAFLAATLAVFTAKDVAT